MATGKKAQPWEGRYDLCEELGEGGNAKVFRVREKSTGKEFALKQLVKKAQRKKLVLLAKFNLSKNMLTR